MERCPEPIAWSTRKVARSTSKFLVFSSLAPEVATLSRTIVLSANTSWFITNFCAGLVRAIQREGYEPIVIAPNECDGALAVQHIDISIDRSGLNPIADLSLMMRYRRLLARIRPAAYLGFTIKPNIYGSMAAALLGIPAVPNVSGLGTAFMQPGALQRFVSLLYRIAFRGSPAVFFQNEDDRRLFVERGIVRSKQSRLLPGLGIDLDDFAATPPGHGPPVFLFVGRLLRDKGVFEFVEAARALRRILPEARFQLLGPIDESNRTAIAKGQIDSWMSIGDVEYLGAAKDVRPFIAAATAVVLPSYREGIPRSLLEGGAMARPLIATQVPGCTDVVENGVNGYLCAARDPDSLAAAMQRVAELTPAQRATMGKAARARVQERFSEELVIRAYIDILAGLKTI